MKNLIKILNNTNLANSDFGGLSKYKEQLSILLQKINNPTIEIPKTWKPAFEVISNLSEQQQRGLTLSMFTSYYTPKDKVNAIVKPLLEILSEDIQGPIHILEPAAGNGNFVSPFIRAKNKTKITAVEKEYIAFQQLEKQLYKYDYPKELPLDLIHSGFEKTKFKKPFDLIISNVPFGAIKVTDPSLNFDKNLYHPNIQNYFFLKALNLAKPGGIIAFICSRNFADSLSNTILKETVFSQSNLISAIRFDNTTFLAEKTAVTTDLIVLQKVKNIKEKYSQNELDFIQIQDAEIGTKNQLFISSYFANNPNRVLGKLSQNFFHNTFNLTVEPTFDTQKINELIGTFLTNDLKQINHFNLSKEPIDFQNEHTSKKYKIDIELQKVIKKKYPLAIAGNLICYHQKIGLLSKENDHFIFNVLRNQKNVELYNAAILLRDTYKNLLIQKNEKNEKQTLKLQQDLQYNYQLFTFQYGFLNEPHIQKLIRLDFDMPLLSSLEYIDEKGQYLPCDILIKKINFEQEQHKQLTDLPTIIANSYNLYNKINTTFISEVLNQKPEQWIQKAIDQELLYINPSFDENGNFKNLFLTDRSSFISGYICHKIAYFKNNIFPSIIENKEKGTYQITAINFLKDIEFNNLKFINQHIKELKKVNPKKLSIAEIDPGLGEGFIPIGIYEKFANEFFEIDNCKIKYLPHKDLFIVKGSTSYKARTGFFFSKQRGAIDWKEILTHALSQYSPTYYYTETTIENKKIKIFDKELTSNVHFKLDELHKGFTNWIQHQNNKGYANHIEKTYFKKNTALVLKNFEADYLTFKGLNPKYIPYLHQKNCVAKQLINGGGIIDHKVGYGKTLTAALINQKRKELKLGHKTLLACMNANYIKIYDELRDYFPEAKILLLKNTDFSNNKNKYLYQIANFEWDMIVVPHSIIERFPTDLTIDTAILNEELFIISETLEAYRNENTPLFDRRTFNNMVKKQEETEQKIKQLQIKLKERRSKGYLSFDNLGIKHIVIDESHQFKNLPFHTKHNRISGLGNPEGAKKNRILLSIVRSVQKTYNADKGISFLSGTTLSNSLVELYNIFRYLRPKKMKNMHLNSLDQWARSFARITNEFEQSLSGEIKHKQRFRWFVKTPELAKLYNEITHYADEHTFDIGAPKPEVNLQSIEPYPKQNQYFEAIKKFLQTSDVSHLIGYNANSDNIKKAKGLIATSQGKKASLDMRLLSSIYKEEANSKVNVAANLLQKNYVKYNKDLGTQLVFCDLGTPTKKENFNVYQALKENLINKGIPGTEIAFIHDAKNDQQKRKLYQFVNAGVIRIVIGSTQKMGTGVNMQERVVQMIDLDIPYRPSDLEQRWGRGARPGNRLAKKLFNNKVPTTIFAVKNSIDSYLFNLLAMKQNFIRQFKNANLTERSIDFGVIDDSGNINFAQYLEACAPDSLLPKKLKTENSIKEVLLRKTSFINNRTVKIYKIKRYYKMLEATKNDLTHYSEQRNDFKNIENINIKIGKQSLKLNDFKNIGKMLYDEFETKFKRFDSSFLIAELSNKYHLNVQIYHDFLEENKNKIKKYKLILNDDKGYNYSYKNAVISKDNIKCGKYVLNAFNTIDNKINELKKNINVYENYIKQSEIEVDKKFPLDDKLIDLEKQLKNIVKQMDKQQDDKIKKITKNKGNKTKEK